MSADIDQKRIWFNYDPKKWSAFEWRYFEELKGNTAVAELNKRLKEHRKLTLSYAATDEEHNHAVALNSFLKGVRYVCPEP